MDAEPHYTLPAGDPIVVARFRLDDGSLDQAGDAAGLQSGAENGVVRFVVAADGRFDDLLSDVDLHSSARFMLPTFDFDTDRAFDIGVGFYFGESPLVVIMADEPLPIYDVVMAIVYEAIDDLSRDENVEDLYTAARAVRWCVPRRLRQRIRDIEESVRDALDDEHMSANDYTALREYAVRLARVARLASGLRAPTFQGYKPQGRYSGLIDLPGPDVPKNLRDVGDEARESEARLSGLISSQQIVLQQRQAADTERFQRLLTLIGTAVLVPGLVAAIFGANVNFPGNNSSAGFYAMLCFMAASGLGSYVALSSLAFPRRSEAAAHAHRRSTTIMLVVLAALAAIGGVLFL